MTRSLSSLRRLQAAVALPVSLVLVGAALSACAGPPPREYVLAATSTADRAPAAQAALPVVQVERVVLPDYLDTRDIVTRRNREVVTSETGRWAERLSLGATRFLASALAAQLRGVAVTSAQPVDPPALRIVVDVADFDVTEDGPVVLAARWTVTDGSGQKSLTTAQDVFREPVTGTRDGAVVAAMSLALEKLANRISAGIEPNLAQGR
jgi:uncharacterized lipoprotein YmbA